MNALPATLSASHAEITRLRQIIDDLERRFAWSEGRRHDGANNAPGFSQTETRALRILAATGTIRYEQMSALQRHMSNIRRKLRILKHPISIATDFGLGYRVEAGLPTLRALCRGHQANIRRTM